MDLGLQGRKAIVCASSRGLGKACAMSLAREGADVVINGRNAEVLDLAAHEIAAVAKGSVTPIAADINTGEGRARLVAACPEADILVNNNDGPPPGAFQQWDESHWQAALEANLLAPVLLTTGRGLGSRPFFLIHSQEAVARCLPSASALRASLTATTFCKGELNKARPLAVSLNLVIGEFSSFLLQCGLDCTFTTVNPAHKGFSRPGIEYLEVDAINGRRYQASLIFRY